MPTRKSSSGASWKRSAELVSLRLRLQPLQRSSLYPQYAIGLHAWFLDQVRQTDSNLSAYLHDGGSEKPFTVSALQGLSLSAGRSLIVEADQTYDWVITALSKPLTQWLQQWLKQLPQRVELRGAPLHIRDWTIAAPATTYQALWETEILTSPVSLSFVSPTSFRRKSYHLPLPLPVNVFHSYLRRWNDFSGLAYEPDEFLDWIDESVMISRHQLRSQKVLAGKQGSVTGFTGAIEYQLTKAGQQDEEYVQLFHALIQLAPYCGTGHKTTFGLGQTRLGWLEEAEVAPAYTVQDLLAERITELTQTFKARKKRQGGERAIRSAECWATILARRELGESLHAISADLEMPYETVKTYLKLAKQAVQAESASQTEPAQQTTRKRS